MALICPGLRLKWVMAPLGSWLSLSSTARSVGLGGLLPLIRTSKANLP